VKPGDVFGFCGANAVSHFINLVTYGIPWWGLSHVGIMGEHNDNLLLFESTTLTDLPCQIAGRPVAGVQAQHLAARIEHYPGKIWHYPLFRELYLNERYRLSEFLISNIGRPYDEIGAFRSGAVGFSYIESLFHEQNLQSIFCSELVAAAHTRVGLFVTDNYSKWNPNRLVRRERKLNILLKPRRVK